MFIPPSAWFTGFIPDLPTPFDAADAIDLEAFAALCERQIAAGVPAIVGLRDGR
jgi:4-hydroxy-tetrahydrodipicolinate synthase